MLSSTGLLDWTMDAKLSIQAYWLGVCVLCLSALLCPQTWCVLRADNTPACLRSQPMRTCASYLRRAVALCAGRGKLAAAPSGRQHERFWSLLLLQARSLAL
jgi:hypothetical protein